ncbi:MAG: FecR domain-containing protein [Pikeienuella sp.]
MARRITAVLSLLLLTTAMVPAQSAEVGVLAAVNRDMTGARPSEAPRQIFLQDKLVSNEKIESSADGGGQVLFLDQTSLTITKNSQIILDKYVYDPASESGEMGISVLKGAMRIVGGRITKKKPALIRTPSATIGIRGGIGNVTVRPDGSTVYMHVAGISSTIEGVGDEVLTITREGGVAVVQDSGEVEYAGVADPETVDAIFNQKATGEGDGQSTEGESGQTSGNQQQEQQQQQQQQEQQQQQQQQQKQQQQAAANEGAERVSQENSGNGDAQDESPVSTQGERQQRNDTRPDVEIENDSEDEQADNVAQEIAQGIDTQIDQLFFNGTYNPTLTGGAAAGVANNLTFQMVFSIKDEQGLVIVELPDAALNGPAGGSETIDGQAITADSFIVGGPDLQALTGGPGTLLGGDASGVTLAIAPNISVSGDLDIDYTGTSLVNADSLTAAIDPLAGVAVDTINGATVEEIVNGFPGTSGQP